MGVVTRRGTHFPHSNSQSSLVYLYRCLVPLDMASTDPRLVDDCSSDDDDASYELIGSAQPSIMKAVKSPQKEDVVVPSTTTESEEKKEKKELQSEESEKTPQKETKKDKFKADLLNALQLIGILTLIGIAGTIVEKSIETTPSGPMTNPVIFEVFNVRSPALLNIDGFPRGRRIRIVGIPDSDAVRIDVDLRSDRDIPFHFNPRFEKEVKPVVVRNHAVRGEWNYDLEERSGKFPFKRNEIFTLEFVSGEGRIEVLVNGRKFTDFVDRKPSYTKATILAISGQLSIHSVQVIEN